MQVQYELGVHNWLLRMMEPRDIAWLLEDLCVSLGFCLGSEERERLQASPPTDPDSFTTAVFRAEGLDPLTVNKRLYREVHAAITNAFQKAHDRDA